MRAIAELDSIAAALGAQRRLWLTPALLALLSALFFAGVLWTPAEVLAGPDIGGLFIPWLAYARESLQQGVFPFWDTHQFSGYPFFANMQVALFYPPTWLFFLLPGLSLSTGLAALQAAHVWWAGWGMALLARRLGASASGALLAGVVFCFSGFMTVRVAEGHYGLVNTLAWTPWVVLAYWWACARPPRWPRAVAAGAPLGLAILAGHITSVLFIGLILAAALVYALASRGDGPPAGATSARVRVSSASWWLGLLWPVVALALAGMMGAALAGVQLGPTLELAALAARREGALPIELAMFSMYPEMLLALLTPHAFGQPPAFMARGSYAESIHYIGLLPLALALAALLALRVRGRRAPVILLALLSAAGLWLALGTNAALHAFVSEWVPLYALNRAPARAGFLFVFGASALAGLALTYLSDAETRRELFRLPQSTAGRAALSAAGLAAVLFGALAARGVQDLEAARVALDDAALPAFVALLAASLGALLWLASGRWTRRGATLWAAKALVVALALVDLWAFGRPLLRLGPPPPAPAWETVRALTGETFQAEGPFRVLPWGYDIFVQNGATLAEGVESVWGYNAMELAAYQTFAAAPDWRAPVYDVLNARYVMSSTPLEGAEGFIGAAGDSEGRKGAYVYERPGWMPRAWLAGRYEVASDAAARLAQPGFDHRAVALLEAEPPCAPAAPAEGTVEVVEETPERVTLRVKSQGPALLVYSGQFYPGWTATIMPLGTGGDGAGVSPASPVELLRAYSVLRAVCVPAGAHTVTMVLQPTSLTVGAAVSLAAMALVALVALRRARD